MTLSNIHVKVGIFILSLAFVLSACEEPSTSTSKTEKSEGKDLWSLMTGSTNGMISIVANRHLNYTGAQYKAGGTLANPPGTGPANGGTMIAGGVAIVSPGAPPYVYDSDSPGGFGTTCTFGLSGNVGAGIPGFSTTMYVPTEILMSGPLTSTISKSAGATVTWNTDPLNADVIVFANYEIGISRDINPALPGTRIAWRTTAPDNGSYTLTAGNLAAFPVGARVRIGVARGAFKTHTVSGQNYELVGYSAADNFYQIVP